MPGASMPIVLIVPAAHVCAHPYLSLSCVQLDLKGNRLGLVGATALAPAIAANPSLTQLDVKYDALGTEGETVLRTAVEGRSGFELKL